MCWKVFFGSRVNGQLEWCLLVPESTSQPAILLLVTTAKLHIANDWLCDWQTESKTKTVRLLRIYFVVLLMRQSHKNQKTKPKNICNFPPSFIQLTGNVFANKQCQLTSSSSSSAWWSLCCAEQSHALTIIIIITIVTIALVMIIIEQHRSFCCCRRHGSVSFKRIANNTKEVYFPSCLHQGHSQAGWHANQPVNQLLSGGASLLHCIVHGRLSGDWYANGVQVQMVVGML